MKNKKIVKFLGVLISSLIVLGNNGQIFAKKESIKQEENQKTKNTRKTNIKLSSRRLFSTNKVQKERTTKNSKSNAKISYKKSI